MTGERRYTSVEVCAGAGGQALGLHQAGFTHVAVVENDASACETLRQNVGSHDWEDCAVIECDLRDLDPACLMPQTGTLDLLAGGVPCPPFSAAGLQQGSADERDLFPCFLELVDVVKPRAVMIENVRGLLSKKFSAYREEIIQRLGDSGYTVCDWRILEAWKFGVPQLRPRAVLVALKNDCAAFYDGLPHGAEIATTVFDALKDSMASRAAALRQLHAGNPEAISQIDRAHAAWGAKAEHVGKVAPTLVGGSKKHGGGDLGPTRAKRQWAEFGVNGMSIAGANPADPHEFGKFTDELGVQLTVQQAMILQGLPRDWRIAGRKTAAYRQVGNAFPPPVAKAVGESIISALRRADALQGEQAPVAAFRFPLRTPALVSQPALPGF
ncbi:DNA (cytosine-5-)-methyltransferase [Streptacidiphilus sp. N1-10]|uniref:Cytosine-specific methyltransferase n=1 Tax=Streptacidiphilus jeojiensis TaxID=3229225 RepID=A0ABV6XIC5_9ACTN